MAVVVSIKQIKGKKLNVDAIRKEIENALEEEAKFHRKELEKTVRTWRDKPTFESLTDYGGGDLVVITGPAGSGSGAQHWVWTDKGTRAHPIVARRAPALRFRAGNIPKTAPGQFSARVGGRVGPWRRPRAVRHPGTKPRKWTEILSKRRRGPFTKRMIKAMQAGASKAF